MTPETQQRKRLGKAEAIVICIVDELIQANPNRLHMQKALGRAREGIGRICTELREMIEYQSQKQPGEHGKTESIDLRESEDRE